MSAQPIDDAFARQHRNAVIKTVKAKIANEGITQPVRIEFERLLTDDTFDGIFQRGPNIWLVAPERGARRTGNVKVERHLGAARAPWTCSCKGWQKQRGVDCKHISRVRFMIGDGGAVPYDGRRRRIRTKVVYPYGYAEDTRIANARAAEPAKVPMLASQLSTRFVEQPPREHTKSAGGGANGVPLRARIYALLMKVFWNLSYEQLRQRLAKDGRMEQLGLLKETVPCVQTFVRWFGDSALTPILMAVFEETTKPTKRFDTMVVGDSHDIPTRMVDNSRDRKFGPGQAKYRNAERPLVRQHFAVGKVSNIIYAIDTSLTTGPGSGDGPHLQRLLEQVKARAGTVTAAAFDKAYTGADNFFEAEWLDIDLYVRERGGEDRQAKHWPEMAKRLSRVERNSPGEYAETYRFRSKAEGTPSSIKVRNPYVRLRRRKNDPTPEFPDIPKNKAISELSKDVRDALFDAATWSVGTARLNESLAILIIANLRQLNMLEHKYDQEVTFEEDVVLNPPITLRERDIDGAA